MANNNKHKEEIAALEKRLQELTEKEERFLNKDRKLQKIEREKILTPAFIAYLGQMTIYRSLVSVALTLAGCFTLYIGSTIIGNGTENILLEIGKNFHLTAGGLGAVIMVSGIFIFYFAYKARPTIHVVPIPGSSGYSVYTDEDKILTRLIKRLRKNWNNNSDSLQDPSVVNAGGNDDRTDANQGEENKTRKNNLQNDEAVDDKTQRLTANNASVKKDLYKAA